MKIKDVRPIDVEKATVYQYLDRKEKIIKIVKMKQKRILEDSGYFLISGKIRINDGTEYPAIIGISSDDSGELFEAYFLINNYWISQSDKKFLKKISKNKKGIFPYKYHLNVEVEGDINKEHQF